MSEQTSDQEFQWCLVGNIVEERPYGEGGEETRPGTKHFSPGSKVYCLPTQWGDGYEQIVVIGRHRGSKEFKTMIISSKWVTNWRAKVVYNPEVLRRIRVATSESWKDNWESKDEVEGYVKMMCSRMENKELHNIQLQRIFGPVRALLGRWLNRG